MNEIDDLFDRYDTDTVLLKIRNHIWFTVKGIWHMDTSAKGIYGKPTLYIWVYKDCREPVIKDVMKLYPNIFYVFESSIKDKDKTDDKFIIKINHTNTPMPTVTVQKEEKSKCVII